jgi:CBS domain containing-hemolysin-like protein
MVEARRIHIQSVRLEGMSPAERVVALAEIRRAVAAAVTAAPTASSAALGRSITQALQPLAKGGGK